MSNPSARVKNLRSLLTQLLGVVARDQPRGPPSSVSSTPADASAEHVRDALVKRVLFVRSATAVPSEPRTGDFGRPLSELGVEQCERVQTSYYRNARVLPGAVVASPAARAVETARLLVADEADSGGGGDRRGLMLCPELYDMAVHAGMPPGDGAQLAAKNLPPSASVAKSNAWISELHSYGSPSTASNKAGNHTTSTKQRKALWEVERGFNQACDVALEAALKLLVKRVGKSGRKSGRPNRAAMVVGHGPLIQRMAVRAAQLLGAPASGKGSIDTMIRDKLMPADAMQVGVVLQQQKQDQGRGHSANTPVQTNVSQHQGDLHSNQPSTEAGNGAGDVSRVGEELEGNTTSDGDDGTVGGDTRGGTATKMAFTAAGAAARDARAKVECKTLLSSFRAEREFFDVAKQAVVERLEDFDLLMACPDVTCKVWRVMAVEGDAHMYSDTSPPSDLLPELFKYNLAVELEFVATLPSGDVVQGYLDVPHIKATDRCESNFLRMIVSPTPKRAKPWGPITGRAAINSRNKLAKALRNGKSTAFDQVAALLYRYAPENLEAAILAAMDAAAREGVASAAAAGPEGQEGG